MRTIHLSFSKLSSPLSIPTSAKDIPKQLGPPLAESACPSAMPLKAYRFAVFFLKAGHFDVADARKLLSRIHSEPSLVLAGCGFHGFSDPRRVKMLQARPMKERIELVFVPSSSDRYPALVIEGLGALFPLYESGLLKLRRPRWYERGFRLAAIRYLVDAVGRDVRTLTLDDFYSYGFGRMLNGYYNDSPLRALQDAGYAYTGRLLKPIDAYSLALPPSLKIFPWEMAITPNHLFDEPYVRRLAIRWLVERTEKSAWELNRRDFIENGLKALLNRFEQSPYQVLVGAGLAYSQDEIRAMVSEKKMRYGPAFYPWEMERAPLSLRHSALIEEARRLWREQLPSD